MVAVISVDAYLFFFFFFFFDFSDLTCHLEDKKIGLFWSPDSKETELGCSNQEAFFINR